MRWYDWRNVRERLITFGRAVQGIAPYRVEIELDPNRCATGFCNYTRRIIAVNPAMFESVCQPSMEYNLTRALLVHEAGHRRFTEPLQTDQLLHQVINVLEDQRIENLMFDSFSGLRHLIRTLSEVMYDKAPAIDPGTDSPGEVIGAILQARWATHLGKPLKGTLSEKNQAIFDQAIVLARLAWDAPSTIEVKDYAQRIIDLLGLKEMPQWVNTTMAVLGTEQGERSADDKAEDGDASGQGKDDSQKSGDAETPAGLSDVGMAALPSSASAGVGEFAIEPKPYICLVDRMAPLAEELADELALAWRSGSAEYSARGQRLSIRELLRHPDEPFLTEAETKQIPSMVLRVVCDHSTSMNLHGKTSKTRMESVAEGAMLVHLFAVQAHIEHQIVVTPNDVRIADLESGERGLALIAGLVPGLTWYEDLGKAIETHCAEMVQRPQEVKVLICAHDGYPNDPDVAREACKKYRGQVEVLGVGIDLDDECANEMRKIFSPNRLLLCQKAEELPQRLASLIRSIYGL